MSAVILRQVSKVYPNGFKAVHEIDLDVTDGEFMVLIGPSGCAKSTTLRMIAGLESITGGEVRIGGKIVNNLPPYERGIAMVFQNYALYPHMKVHRNLSFGLRLKHQPRRRSRRRSTRWRPSWRSRSCWIGCPRNCRAARRSGWRWAAR